MREAECAGPTGYQLFGLSALKKVILPAYSRLKYTKVLEQLNYTIRKTYGFF